MTPEELKRLHFMLENCDVIRMSPAGNIVHLRNNCVLDEEPPVGIEFDETEVSTNDPEFSFDIEEVHEGKLEGNVFTFLDGVSFEMLSFKPFPQTELPDYDGEKTFDVPLTRTQIEAVSTQFSIMAGTVQYKGATCPEEEVAQFTREWELYRGIAKTVSSAIGYDGYMDEKTLHPGAPENEA